MTKDSFLGPLNIALEEYERTVRHPQLPRFDRSDLYALFPKNKESLPDVADKMRWSEGNKWPNNDRAGIYVIFGSRPCPPLYVGVSDCVGDCLANYFGYDGERGCRLKHSGWTETPMYVATIGIPKGTEFEAFALERYLIWELQPSNNSLGLKPK